jgi:hypothetical protein
MKYLTIMLLVFLSACVESRRPLPQGTIVRQVGSDCEGEIYDFNASLELYEVVLDKDCRFKREDNFVQYRAKYAIVWMLMEEVQVIARVEKDK